MSRGVEPFQFTDEVKRRAGWWGSPYYEIRIATELILTLCCVGMAIAAFVILRSTDNTSYGDLTDNWQARPIVDIISLSAESSRCPLGYERFSLDSSMIKEIQGGSCVCYDNVHGFQSGPVECSEAALANGCTSARFSHGIVPHSWRGVSYCYSRSEQAAASWRPDGDDRNARVSRPYPDISGGCPSGYRRCGERSQYADGAVCIPKETLCPITNIQIVDKSTVPRVIDGWEPVGALQNGSLQLYVRREGAGELPIVDIALAFKETSELALTNTHHGPGQAYASCPLNNDAVFLSADPDRTWAYESVLPPGCDRPDPRYHLLDEVPLQDYYLQQLQHQEPSCTGYSVLPLTDAQYVAARDPDYANSGVTCQSSGQQSCFLDGTTTGTCSTNDTICDVAVNQNTCGAYTHAIRSAFADTTVSLGLYFRREIPWVNTCDVSRNRVSHLHHSYESNVVFTMGWGLFFTLSTGLLLNGLILVLKVYYKPGVGFRLRAPCEERYVITNMVVRFPSMVCYLCAWFHYSNFYGALRAVHSGSCTDAFTQSLFQYTAGLTGCAYLLFFLCIIEVLLWAVASIRFSQLSKIHSTVREEALAEARNVVSAYAAERSRQAAPPVAASAEVRVPEVMPSKMVSVPAPEQATAAVPVHAPATGVMAATRATAHRLGRSLRRQLRSATGTPSTAYQPLQETDYADPGDDDDSDDSYSGDVELRTVVASMV